MRVGVFIGRFQPIHNIHAEIIQKSLQKYDKLIIIIGSSKSTPSIRNPFNDDDRMRMIHAITEEYGNYEIVCLSDSNYNFTQWIKNVQRIVIESGHEKDEIYLIGHFKDSGSYWLNYFPQWKLDDVGNKNIGKSYTCNGTWIRENFLGNWDHWEECVPIAIVGILKVWKKKNLEFFNYLQRELMFIKEYKEKWEKAPFPPTFVTVDSLVICKGNILLIKRGRHPGKGSYALPGGFVNQFEFLKDAAIRELKEETKINVNKIILENSIKQIKVIDNPYRDERGRMITHVHVFELNLKDLPEVKAADDACEVKWEQIGKINSIQNQFYADHYQIIKSII